LLDTRMKERRVRAPMNFQIKFSIATHALASYLLAHPCLREGVALARLDELTR
jgi:hypothetical protein